MKKLTLIYLLFSQISFSQNKVMDSLQQQLLLQKADTAQLQLIKELAINASSIDLNLTMKYCREGLLLATSSKNTEMLPWFNGEKGRTHANLLQLDSASYHFEKALEGFMANDNKKGQASTLTKIAWVHKKRGKLEQALQADLKAIKLLEQIKDQKGIAGVNNRLSDDLLLQGRYAEALDYALKNITLCKEIGFEQELVYSYTAAGGAYIHQSNPQQALENFDQALLLARSLGFDKMSLSDFTNNRGNALKRLGRYKEALAVYDSAMNYARETNYANAIHTVTANLGEINLLIGNYPEALKYQLETIRLMEENSDLSNLTENYGHVSTIYEKLGNYPKALEFQKKSRQMRDSTARLESDKAMSDLLTQYETEKKESTIAAQEKQLAQQRMVQWLGIGIAALLAVLLLFGYRSYQARTRSNRLLAAKNAENELLMKEIHHRVKNNLELVKSLISLQSAHIDDPDVKNAMLASRNRVQSMGIIHQKLYMGENLGSIEMKDYFIHLGEGILESFNATDKVTIECAMENLELDVDTAVPIGLIVNELLTNALKYAFPENATGKISISLTKADTNELTLQVADNGVGKQHKLVPAGTGFGTQLIQLLTQQLNGIMEEKVASGTSVLFRFKTLA